MSEEFKTISAATTGEFKDRGSRFIAYCFPVASMEDITDKISFVKKEHPKARHHCYAFRLGTDKNIFRANDDGEPSGTAGKPILGQLDSFGITNVILIVVRYFGGTLLGTGGLINAYREAAKISLSKAPIVNRKLFYSVTIHCEYTLLPELMTLLKRLEIKIIDQDFTEGCLLKIISSKDHIEKLNDLRGLKIETAPLR